LEDVSVDWIAILKLMKMKMKRRCLDLCSSGYDRWGGFNQHCH